MSMALRAALQGDLTAYMDKQVHGVQKGIRVAVVDGAKAVQKDWRGQVNATFSGSKMVRGGNRRVANAIRLKEYTTEAGGASAIVFSKFGRKGPGGKFIDYLIPHATGATLRPTRGRWLYIPLQGSRRARSSRLAVAQNKNLSFVPIGPGRALLVRRTRSRSTPIALLVRMIRIPKTISLDQATRREDAA